LEYVSHEEKMKGGGLVEEENNADHGRKRRAHRPWEEEKGLLATDHRPYGRREGLADHEDEEKGCRTTYACCGRRQ
jgi:hypothetical protein